MKKFKALIAALALFLCASAQYPPLTLNVGNPACNSITLTAQYTNSNQSGIWRSDVTPQYSSDGSNWSSLSAKSIYNPSGPTSQSWSFTSAGFWYFRWQVSYYYNYGGGYTFIGSATYNNSQTSSVYYAATAGFNINGVNVSATSPYEGYGYACPDNALILNNTSAGNVNNPKWQLYYQECNSTGGGLTGPIYPGTSWNNGWPNTSYNLKSELGGFLGTSAAVGKYYLITLKVKNGCNGTESVKQGLVHINSGPSAPGGVLRINRGDGTNCKSQNLGSPCLAGAYSGGMFLQSTTGLILYYRVTIDEVNCSTRAFVSNIYTGVNQFASSSLFANIGLNYITNNYFANNTGTVVGKCYKLTVVFGNQCNSSTEWSYFKIDGVYKTDLSTNVFDMSDAVGRIDVFPNPANHILNIGLYLTKPLATYVTVTDMAGRNIALNTTELNLTEGENSFPLDVSGLASGMYLLHVSSQNGKLASLRFIKE